MGANKFTRRESVDNFVTERVDVIKNNLLGNYDDQGKYFITNQVITELISVPKRKKTTYENAMFCVGDLLGYGQITFQIVFSNKLKKEDATATLYLLEGVDKVNGYYQNTIKTKVAIFKNSVNNFLKEALNFFNVITEDIVLEEDEESNIKSPIDDEMLTQSYILAKKQYSLLLDKLADEKCLDAYGKYFTARYSALTRMNNDFSNAVLELFNQEYARIEKYFLKEKNYRMLNELLDKCIEEVSGTSEKYIKDESDFKEITASALESFTNSITKLHEKMSAKALNMLDKKDRAMVEDIKDVVDKRNIENDSPSFVDTVPVFSATDEIGKEPKETEATERFVADRDTISKNKEEDTLSTIRDRLNNIKANNSKTSQSSAKKENSSIEKESTQEKPKKNEVAMDNSNLKSEETNKNDNQQSNESSLKPNKNLDKLYSYLNMQRTNEKVVDTTKDTVETSDDTMNR